MKIVTSSKVVLSVEDLHKIVAEYLANNTVIQGNIVSITHNVAKEEIPGYDPHDCEYRDVFAGITVVVEKDK